MTVRVWTLAFFLCAAGVSSGAAQEGASLAEVEGLIARGNISEARETLESWWTTRYSSSSRAERQRGIWLRGKLTVDPTMAELDFRRLVLEFPGGPYSDDALFRLGLSADLRGDLRAAQSSFEALVSDYPSSPRVPEARAWIMEHARAVSELPEATPEEPPRQDPAAGSMSGGGAYAVQIGAFRSLDRARSVALQLNRAGYEPRLVRTPGNDLAKVRVGRFSEREEAAALARELERLGFDVSLATDAGSEERVGEASSTGLPAPAPSVPAHRPPGDRYPPGR